MERLIGMMILAHVEPERLLLERHKAYRCDLCATDCLVSSLCSIASEVDNTTADGFVYDNIESLLEAMHHDMRMSSGGRP